MMRRAVGLLALSGFAVCAYGLWRAPAATASAWLAAYSWALGPALGSLTLLLMLQLAGGPWAPALRPVLRAMAGAVPLLFALGLPLLIAAHELYPWLRGDVAPGQQWWLNPWTIVIGLGACAAFWWALERRLRSDAPLSRASAGGMALLHLLATSVVATNLLMSLQAAYHSSSFALELASSHALAAMALALLVTPPLPRRFAAPASGVLLMLSLLWTYLHFMSYLTVWTADLPDEIAWVLPRTQSSWGALSALAFVLQGPLTIMALAVPRLRRGPALRVLGGCVLLGSVLFAQVQVGGAVYPDGVSFGVFQVAALCAIAAARWLALTRRYKRPVKVLDAEPQPASIDAGPETKPAPQARSHGKQKKAASAEHDGDSWKAEAQWDVAGRLASRLALGFGIALCVLLIGGYGYWGTLFAGKQHDSEQARNAVPPTPRLQTHAADDRETMLAAQHRQLESYGWIDEQRGIAHIPIERAMQLQAREQNR